MEPSPSISSIKDRRRARLAALLDEHGKVGLSKLVDISADYLWQMGKGEGKSRRGISDINAAKIEKNLQKPAGWMDAAEGLEAGRATQPISRREEPFTEHPPARSKRVSLRGSAMVDAAGYWQELEQSGTDERVDAITSDPDAYAVRIIGRRYHPSIESGQCILVEPNTPLKVAKRVLVQLADGRHTVRSYLSHADGLWMFMGLIDGNDILELRDDEVTAVHRVTSTFDID